MSTPTGAKTLPVLVDRLCWREEGIAGRGDCPRLAEVIHCRNCPEYARIGRMLFERAAPEDLGRETAELLAIPEQEAVGETVSLLVFRLGEERFALKAVLFQEVAPARPVHRIPLRRGPVLLGLVNVSGELLPCVSAAAALGLPAGPPKHGLKTRLCVIGRPENRFAFFVDEALAIRRVPAQEFHAPPATVANAPAAKSAALFHLDGKEIAVLDEERVLESLSRSLHA